jgi:hypothetical protein
MRPPRVSPALAFLLFIILGFPYFFDVAFCEDLYDLPISQAALIDAEKVNSYHGSTFFAFLHVGTVPKAPHRIALPSSGVSQSLDEVGFSAHVSPVLISRPPPSA